MTCGGRSPAQGAHHFPLHGLGLFSDLPLSVSRGGFTTPARPRHFGPEFLFRQKMFLARSSRGRVRQSWLAVEDEQLLLRDKMALPVLAEHAQSLSQLRPDGPTQPRSPDEGGPISAPAFKLVPSAGVASTALLVVAIKSTMHP